MTREEAIARIRGHKIIHKMDEPRAIYIKEKVKINAYEAIVEALRKVGRNEADRC